MTDDEPARGSRVEQPPIPMDPRAAIRPGKFDSAALLVLWALRSAVPAVFIAGMIYAWLATGRGLAGIQEVTTFAKAWRVLLSPLAGIAIAVILRVAVGLAALALAYPLSRTATGSTIGPDIFRRPFRVWSDRLHLVSAYRALRWTWTVRQIAAGRIGRWGKVLSWSGPVLLVVDVVLVIALLLVVKFNPLS